MKALLAAVFAALVLAPAALASHPAGLYTKTDQIVTMDDGVGLATTLYVPVTHGERSPAVMLFHGLGGNRQSLDRVATLLAQRGYIALSVDFRGHGQSGGLFTAIGARELLDIARLREAWLPTNAPVDGDKVGAWGISLGGGAALRAAGEGTPFKAIEVVETWTDLYEALVPQDLPKTGAIFQFLGAVPRERQGPEVLAIQQAVANRDVAALRAFSLARSSRQLLSRGYPPTLFMQGRRDFAFGLEQGIAGWQRHPGPKGLYIGAFGHSPSTFPGPDFELVMQRVLQWFDVHVAGSPDTPNRPAVELANESGTAVKGYAGLPPTARHVYSLRGTATIGSSGKVVRRVRAPRLLETFGAPTVQVRALSATGWSHLVAVLVARTPDGREIVVSEGGAPTSLGRRARAVTIRLISQVTKIPAGSRLELTLAGTSTAQNPANLLYLVPVPERARIALSNVRLEVPALRTPVSR
ncbi:MAG TPA: alpha/beta fold hydrolase [Gaiellaceae bacterium]|nr:alpha/beta fold hydrolase [Gaiellaceae bacterium]